MNNTNYTVYDLQERIKQGFGDDGKLGGAYTKENPPPGKKFDGYLKGFIGINWADVTEQERTKLRKGGSLSLFRAGTLKKHSPLFF